MLQTSLFVTHLSSTSSCCDQLISATGNSETTWAVGCSDLWSMSAQVASTAGKLQRTAAELAEVSAARADLEELLQQQTAQTAQRQQVLQYRFCRAPVLS